MTESEMIAINVTEVAVFLRLTESTVYKLAQEGKLPGRKIGGTWGFSREQVEALMVVTPVDSQRDGLSDSTNI